MNTSETLDSTNELFSYEEGQPYETEMTYEEEQLQVIIMKEIEVDILKKRREIIEEQDKEYLSCLKKEEKELKEDKVKSIVFEEVSLEEMRRIRLQRFNK